MFPCNIYVQLTKCAKTARYGKSLVAPLYALKFNGRTGCVSNDPGCHSRLRALSTLRTDSFPSSSLSTRHAPPAPHATSATEHARHQPRRRVTVLTARVCHAPRALAVVNHPTMPNQPPDLQGCAMPVPRVLRHPTACTRPSRDPYGIHTPIGHSKAPPARTHGRPSPHHPRVARVPFPLPHPAAGGGQHTRHTAGARQCALALSCTYMTRYGCDQSPACRATPALVRGLQGGEA